MKDKSGEGSTELINAPSTINIKENKFHFDYSFFEQPRQYGDIYLYQIGDRLCKGGLWTARHVQICHEISCVISGTGEFFANGKSFQVKPGDIFISPFGVTHSIHSSQQLPLRYSYCGFMLDTGSKEKEYAEIMDFFASEQVPLAEDRYSSVRQMFSMLLNDLIINDPHTDFLVRAGLEQLLVLTRRCYEKQAAPQKEPCHGDYFTRRMVYDIVNYIDNNIFGIKKLTDISNQLGYSYSYVSQTFVSVMGRSVSSYYQQRRFEKAVELLEKSNTVTQVSEALGFDSVQSFSRFFQKNCGTPPSKYIRSLKRNGKA